MEATTYDAATLTQQVQVVNGAAHLKQNGQSRTFDVKELPSKFVRWQLDYKHSVYDAIERDEYIAFNAGHLPSGTYVYRLRTTAGVLVGVMHLLK